MLGNNMKKLIIIWLLVLTGLVFYWHFNPKTRLVCGNTISGLTDNHGVTPAFLKIPYSNSSPCHDNNYLLLIK